MHWLNSSRIPAHPLEFSVNSTCVFVFHVADVRNTLVKRPRWWGHCTGPPSGTARDDRDWPSEGWVARPSARRGRASLARVALEGFVEPENQGTLGRHLMRQLQSQQVPGSLRAKIHARSGAPEGTRHNCVLGATPRHTAWWRRCADRIPAGCLSGGTGP